MENKDYRLGQIENYNPLTQNCWPFKRSIDVVNGIKLKLSNMCGGFDFPLNGKNWKSSEVLYLCGEFDGSTELGVQIQNELIAATSGYGAKRFIKAKYKEHVREDFPTFRLQWMLFVVWQKCLGSKAFQDLLLSIPSDAILIEDTTTDNGGTANIWGCGNTELTAARKAAEEELTAKYTDSMTKKALKEFLAVEVNKIQAYGTWVGENNIGKILMICRDCLRNHTEPDIDYELLNSKNICILGEKLTFTTV